MSKRKLARQQQQQSSLQIHGSMQSFSGPIPPPELLARYNQIMPDAAERILRMAEKQSDHRQELEKKVVSSDIQNSFLGLIFALIICLSCIGASSYLIYLNHELGGSLLGSSSLAALTYIFVYGSQQRRKERDRKLGLIDSK